MLGKSIATSTVTQIPVDRPAGKSARRLAVTGGLLGAIAASSCCIVPLLLFSLGVSGAWIGTLTRLAVYQPYILAATAVCLGYGYWHVYQTRSRSCGDGEACARPMPNRLMIAGLIFATLLVIAAVAFNWLAPLFFRP